MVEACRTVSIASDAQCSSVNRTSTQAGGLFRDKKGCPHVYATASLTAFTGRALMTFRRATGYVEGGNLAIPLDGGSKRTVGMTAEPVRWQASVGVAPRRLLRQGRRGISSD